MAGVVDYLGRAARLSLELGVASSSSRRRVERHLARLALRCVAVPSPFTAGLDLSATDIRLASLADLS